ncbi:hypothetical protein GCM10023144_25840 [Pigmentiphaga soli]|uniref:HTH marR-type domain-containing protein n=1 Tax=Pigmentiphaga soli TaxID=1007095 RepID=A0ABP8H4K3_9BURK
MLHDILAFRHQLNSVSKGLAEMMDVTQHQFEILMLVNHFGGGPGISIGEVSAKTHRVVAYVAAETSKLVGMGLLTKHQDERDGRRTLLRMTPEARDRLAAIRPFQCEVNDVLFSALTAKDFAALRSIMQKLAQCGQEAQTQIEYRVRQHRHAKA